MLSLLQAYAPAFIGGLLIGLSAILLMIFNGRIAGISGIVSAVLPSATVNKKTEVSVKGALGWQWYFLIGLILSGVFYSVFVGNHFNFNSASTPMLMLGGLLVGLGANIGSGCTSGHGVCGIGRLSMRSIVATCVFMGVAVVTAIVLH